LNEQVLGHSGQRIPFSEDVRNELIAQCIYPRLACNCEGYYCLLSILAFRQHRVSPKLGKYHISVSLVQNRCRSFDVGLVKLASSFSLRPTFPICIGCANQAAPRQAWHFPTSKSLCSEHILSFSSLHGQLLFIVTSSTTVFIEPNPFEKDKMSYSNLWLTAASTIFDCCGSEASLRSVATARFNWQKQIVGNT